MGDRFYAYNKGPMGPDYIPSYLQGQKAMIMADCKNLDQETQAVTLPEYPVSDNTDSCVGQHRLHHRQCRVGRHLG